MKNKIKKLPPLLFLFVMFFLASGSSYKSYAAAPDNPDFTGKWDISFYDASGKFLGAKTVTIPEDGSISEKAILRIDNTIYKTRISCTVSPDGKVKDGSLTDTDKLEMEGTLSGSFTDSEGSGQWKNYYKTGGTWKAKRSTKQDRQG
jgi:hypothetical protein